LVKVKRLLLLVVLVSGESFHEVDPATQIVRNEERLGLGLASECVTIEVTARHEDELAREDALVAQPHMYLRKSIFDVNSGVNLILSDAGELCAEICQLWVKSRLHIHLEGRLDALRLHVNEDDWELDDLL